MGISLSLLLGAAPVMAQNGLPTTTIPMIVTPHNQTINYRERTMSFAISSNTNYTIMSNAAWLKATKEANGTIIVHAEQNYNSLKRTGILTFTSGNLIKQFSVTQGEDESVEFLKDNSLIIPSSATDNQHNGSETVKNTYDQNTSTLYHSPYSGGISSSNTAILTYNFTNVDVINTVTYVPRSGGDNGNFGQVAVYYKLSGQSTYTLYNNYDFGYSSGNRTIAFTGGLQKPVSIQFVVSSGKNGFASCAEMEFRKSESASSLYNMFNDDMLTTLKPSVTQANIDTISNPFVKALATQIFNKTYTTEYRVGTYNCKISPNTLSNEWNAPGKLYDQIDGPTGINVTPGKHAVYVTGLADGQSVPMRVVAWFSQDLYKNDKGETVGGGPADYNYTLRNGMNVINYTGTKDGLAYIRYYADTDSAVAVSPNVKVHFINGQINGYLSPDKTNDEMDKILANATNRCIDLYGSKVHSIWESAALRASCKTTDSKLKGYRQYMNVLDTLVHWEQELLGFMKYGREPKGSHTMAYVNYTYYMFQGSYGVSFKYDNQSRVLNCNNIVYNDDDAIWGLSHEWGHQHQMTPYFCWSGLSESSNNMNSCYNVLHMGYSGSHGARIQDNWTKAYNEFVSETAYYDGATKVYYPGTGSSKRADAQKYASEFNWCSELQQAATKQDTIITSVKTDPEHAVSTNEVYVEQNTAPFFMLYCYFSGEGGKPDYAKDMYEALRQTDDVNGSTIEKKDGVDKYEMLASIQNGNKNNKYMAFKNKYATSCWITNGYITAGLNYTQNSVPFIMNYIRKVSRISGYNLFPFFDKFGFLRTICLRIDDYGTKHYAMTAAMKAEFKADMEALGLKTLTDTMIEKISHSSIPTFKTPVFPN